MNRMCLCVSRREKCSYIPTQKESKRKKSCSKLHVLYKTNNNKPLSNQYFVPKFEDTCTYRGKIASTNFRF